MNGSESSGSRPSTSTGRSENSKNNNGPFLSIDDETNVIVDKITDNLNKALGFDITTSSRGSVTSVSGNSEGDKSSSSTIFDKSVNSEASDGIPIDPDLLDKQKQII